MPKPIHRREYAAVRAALRRLRIEARVKQAELSALLGKPQPYISAIETGQRRVDLVEVREICEALGIGLPEFVERLERAIRSPNRKSAPKRTRVG